MISFVNVVARYPGSPKNAVDGVTFEAGEGAVTALAGPNGSGKSTLVRALVKAIPLVSGAISVAGKNLRDLKSADVAREVAVLPQREDTAFPLTVREYVALGRFPHLGLWRARSAADDAIVERAITRAEIEDFAARKTDELSGGEWQRVRLARALAQDARTLVVDEPTTFLDIAHEMAIFELLSSLAAGGLAILVVSHQLNLVSRFADHVVLLERGRVASQGTPADVMEPALLERVFDWPMAVTTEAASGLPAVFPLRKAFPPNSTKKNIPPTPQ